MEHEQGIFDPSRCSYCGKKWPCEVARLIDENARLRSQLEDAGLMETDGDPDDQPILVLPDPDPIIEARCKELELENAQVEKQNERLTTRIRQLETKLKVALEQKELKEEPKPVVAPAPIVITRSDEETDAYICMLRDALWHARSDHSLSVESWSIVQSAFEEEPPPCPHATAIRKHRDSKGHERCWLNDLELYQTLHEPIPEPDLPPRCEFIANCEAYYDGHRGESIPCPHLRRTEELERKLREYGRRV